MNLLITLGNRIKAADPHHFAIFKGMASVALFVFLGKVMGATKEMAVAYRYGLGAEVDAYQFVYNLIAWPVGVWGSVLTAVLVPLAVRVRQSDSETVSSFRSELLGFALVFGLALSLMVWLGLAAMLRYGWSGLPADTTNFAREALPGLILLLPLGMLVALQSAWMLSAGRHVNTLLDSIPAFFICIAVLVFPISGVVPLVWGTVLGTVAHLISLVVPMVLNKEIETPRFTHSSLQWPLFWQGFGIILAGQALMSLTAIIDQFFAVDFGTGAIAILGYANRILSLILGLAAVAVSRATLPVFSQSRLSGAKKLHGVASYWVRLMFFIGLVATVIGYFLAPWMVKILFERGAFSASDTRAVAEVLRYGLLQLPFYFVSAVLGSYALSQRCYKLIFWSSVVGIVSKVIANAILFPSFGINGIAAASSLMAAFISMFFWISIGRTKCVN